MSSVGKTKRDILKLLSKKQYTLTDISRMLSLSPSTVKQHMDELQEMGAIQPVENEFIKRWKYYRAVPNFEIAGPYTYRTPIVKNIVPYVAGIIIVLGLAGFSYYLLAGHGGVPTAPTTSLSTVGAAALANSSYLLSVKMTDPPNVPDGTNALILSYSSVALLVQNGTGPETWLNVSGSGEVNLMSLVNVSQVLASTALSANDVITGVELNANSSYIVIYNKSYAVEVPDTHIIANISPIKLESNSSILVDFSPTVVSIYTANSTIFVMVPSLKAVFYGSSPGYSGAQPRPTRANFTVGMRSNLTIPEVYLLKNLSASYNVVVTNPSISVSGNTTDVSVTVSNDGNRSVTLRQLQIVGQIAPHVLINSNSSVDIHVLRNGQFPSGRLVISAGNQMQGHIAVSVNAPPGLTGSVSGAVGTAVNGAGSSVKAGGSATGGLNAGGPGAGANAGANAGGSIAGAPGVGTGGNTGGYSHGAGAGIGANSYYNASIRPSFPQSGGAHFQYNLSINASAFPTPPMPPMPGIGGLLYGNSTFLFYNGMSYNGLPFNVNFGNSTWLNMTGNFTPPEIVGINTAFLNQLTFFISSNGTLVLPQDANVMADFMGSGYVLAPGATETLTFSGSISYGNGNIVDLLTSGGNYSMVVITDQGIPIRSNVTVSGS